MRSMARYTLAIGLLAFLAARWSTPISTAGKSVERASTSGSLSTQPIEQIRVGQRVIAGRHEDVEYGEPDWNTWLKVTATMIMPSSHDNCESDFLEIELIRPENWVSQRLRFTTEPSLSLKPIISAEQIGVPLRGIYLDLIDELATIESRGLEARELTLDVDLPAMGAVGPATVISIEPCPSVNSGPGEVVTATFAHPATAQVLEVSFTDSALDTDVRETVRVTENHPFWSADRLDFVPIGQISINERVQTYSGNTKRVVGKLPRPGPERVYNLEVYGQHTYCVGRNGLLVHNDCLRDDWENNPRDRNRMSDQEARENGLNIVSPKSALITGKPLSTSEIHHIASPYNKRLKQFFDKMGLDIFTHETNLVKLDFHRGPHLPEYHQLVYRVLSKSVAGKDGPVKLLALNAALDKLGRFLLRHKAIPNHFRL